MLFCKAGQFVYHRVLTRNLHEFGTFSVRLESNAFILAAQFPARQYSMTCEQYNRKPGRLVYGLGGPGIPQRILPRRRPHPSNQCTRRASDLPSRENGAQRNGQGRGCATGPQGYRNRRVGVSRVGEWMPCTASVPVI